MKLVFILFSLISILGVSPTVISRPIEYGYIPYSRDISDSPPLTRADYLRKFPESQFVTYNTTTFHRTSIPQRDEDGRILLTVNHRLLEAHVDQFEIYRQDLQDEGYDVTLFDVEGGTAEELKSLLVQEGGDDVVGIVFAGQMPLAWFEQSEYFNSEEEPDNLRLAEYPIDLFFMDFNGDWIDTSGNGIYDGHSGEWEPDVWLGRIAAYDLSRLSEDSLVGLYLDRAHAFRQGELTLPHKALGYIDDDWAFVAKEWGEEMQLAFGLVDVEADPETTSVAGYINRLGEGYELVQVAVHSTADSHLFRVDRNRQNEYFRFRTLREDVVPQTFFYNLFACSAMNLNRNLCLGALYSLKPPFGLGAVGSTKVGGMLFFDDYYAPLGEGETFGNAFKNWFTLHAHDAGHENWARSWFYGMTYFGDPTLKVPRGLQVVENEVLDDDGDGDGIPDAGETVDVRLFLTNRSERVFSNISGIVITDDTLISIQHAEFEVEGVAVGQVIAADGVRITVGPETPDNHKVIFTVRMTPLDAEPWWDRVSLVIRNAKIQPTSFATIASEEDRDGFVGPGDSGVLTVSFGNVGGNSLSGQAEVLLEPLDAYFDLLSEQCFIESLAPGQQRVTQAIEYRIMPFANASFCSVVRLHVVRNGIEYGKGVIALPLSADATFTDDFDIVPQWIEHFAVTEGYADVWRWDSTACDGSGGLAFGGPDTLFYPARSDAVLEMPLMILDADAELRIRHCIDVEAEYDACVIEVNRGREWSRAIPIGGYNGRSVEIGTYGGGACWNGSFDWREDRIPLGGPAGAIRVRLRFASDTGVEGGGWSIDHLSVTGTNLETPTKEIMPISPLLLEAYPNPFNSTFRIKYAASAGAIIRMYSASGELVRTLETTEETGIINQTIDYSTIPPGLYFLKLDADSKSLVRKIALVK